MLCRHCGREIADKAIVCYRCGAATTDPTYKAPPPRRAAPSVALLAALLVLVLLAFAALYLGRGQTGVAPQALRRVVIVAAVAFVVVRAVRRRSRR